MIVNPLYLANTIILKSFDERVELTPMKLQKILYFIYREYLQKTGYQIFSERFMTWDYGPVLSTVYYQFKEYCSNNIGDFYVENGKTLAVREDSENALNEAISYVWNCCRDKNGIELSRLTHKEGSAWYKAYQKDAPFLLDEDIMQDEIPID